MYFVPLIIIGSFFMLNLVLGVLSGEFAKERQKVEKRRKFMRARRRAYIQREIETYLHWIQAAENTVLDDPDEADERKFQIIESRRKAAAKHMRNLKRQERIRQMSRRKRSLGKVEVEDDDYEEEDAEEAEIPKRKPSRSQLREKNKNLTSFGYFSFEPKRPSCLHRFFCCGVFTRISNKIRTKLRIMVKTEAWFWMVISIVFVNSLLLGLEHYQQPQWLTDLETKSEYVFASLFALDILIPMYAFGPHLFYQSAFRILDTVVVIGNMFELLIAHFRPDISFGISVLRSMRLLRILKLTKHWTALRNLVLSLFNSIRSIASLIFLLFLFVLIFAMLGMQIFGGRMNFPEGKPAANFDSLPIAMMTVFQILTSEDWNEVLYSGIRSLGGVGDGGMPAAIYFVCLVLLGNCKFVDKTVSFSLYLRFFLIRYPTERVFGHCC